MTKECIVCHNEDELQLLIMEYKREIITDRWWMCRECVRNDEWDKAKEIFYGDSTTEKSS